MESRYRYNHQSENLAGGDAVRGAIWWCAITRGRHAAQGIIDWLGVKSVKSH
ncbi:hypothetical protein ACNKHT_15930 [Shigella flexneri]